MITVLFFVNTITEGTTYTTFTNNIRLAMKAIQRKNKYRVDKCLLVVLFLFLVIEKENRQPSLVIWFLVALDEMKWAVLW